MPEVITSLAGHKKVQQVRRSNAFLRSNLELFLLALPALILFFIFSYLPMIGNIIAFKDFRYDLGIFGSKWVGFENFRFFFSSQDAWRVTRNTVAYGAGFTLIDTVIAVAIAILLYEITGRKSLKFYQTTMMFPRFLSWVVVSYLSYILLNPIHGVLNQIVALLGRESIDWYSNAKYWPAILITTQLWKSVGFSVIMYYAAMMGIDSEMYEAATIDGASWFQKTWHISVPSLVPLISLLTLMAVGNIFKGDFGLFYQLSRDVGALYPATDIIDTYVFRSLKQNNPGMTTAITFFQSVVGLVLITLSNAVIKKFSPENAMF